MTKLLHWLKEEAIQAIPAIIFFAITFNLIVLTERLMLRQETPSYLSYALATLAALIVGKLLIIMNALPFINVFARKPLIYNIVWKFFIYGSAAVIYRLLDKIFHMMFHHQHSYFIYEHLKITLESSVFWAIQLWLLMVFIIYIISSEFIHSIGKERIELLLFGRQKQSND